MVPPRQIAGMLICAIMDDTDGLKSRSTSSLDRSIAAWLEGIIEESGEALYTQMFLAGQRALSRLTAQALVEGDLKQYVMLNGITIAVASVKFDNPLRLKVSDKELIAATQNYQQQMGIDCSIFLKVHLTLEGKRCSVFVNGLEEEVYQSLGIAPPNANDFVVCPPEITSRKRLMGAIRAKLDSISPKH